MDTEKLHSATAKLAAERATWSTTCKFCPMLCWDNFVFFFSQNEKYKLKN